MKTPYAQNLILCMEVLDLVITKKSSLTHALHNIKKRTSGSPPPIIHTITHGTLKNYPYLNHWLSQVTKLKPKDLNLRHLTLCALFQCHFMEVRPHKTIIFAALEACEKLKRNWAKPVLRAVLEKSLREGLQSKQSPASSNRLPDWLYEEITSTYSEQQQKQILKAWDTDQENIALRPNKPDFTEEMLIQSLKKTGIPWKKHPWSSALLIEKKRICEIPGLENHDCYIQDPTHQYLTTALPNLPIHSVVLDACGAPGGKTGALLQRQPQLRIDVVDKNALKQEITRENLQHYHPNVSILSEDSTTLHLKKESIDYTAILLDAPCSATANIGQNPEIKINQTPESITHLNQQQAKLLHATWQSLKPGGYLLYSTCSLLKAENSEQISHFLSSHSNAVSLPLTSPQSGEKSAHGVVILPDNYTRGGFFALLQKVLEKTVDK